MRLACRHPSFTLGSWPRRAALAVSGAPVAASRPPRRGSRSAPPSARRRVEFRTDRHAASSRGSRASRRRARTEPGGAVLRANEPRPIRGGSWSIGRRRRQEPAAEDQGDSRSPTRSRNRMPADRRRRARRSSARRRNALHAMRRSAGLDEHPTRNPRRLRVRAAARGGGLLCREPEAAPGIGHPVPAVGHLRSCPATPASPGRPRISTSSASRATRRRSSASSRSAATEIEIEDERWIGKVWKATISSTSSTTSRPPASRSPTNGSSEVYEVEVYGTTVRITPPTEFILSKLFLQDRYRYDGADVAHVILNKHEEIDWQWLLERDGALLGGAADPRPQFPLHLSDRARPASRAGCSTSCSSGCRPRRDAAGADADLPRPADHARRDYVVDIDRMGLRRRRRQGNRREA